MKQIQTGVTTLFLLYVSFGCFPLSAQIPPGTGAGGAFNDQNFKVVTETLAPQQSAGCSTSDSPCSSGRVPAWVVTKRAGWAPELSGTRWIAPEPDQSSRMGSGRSFASVSYQTQFMATPALTLNARVLADDNVVVSLNGKVVFTSAGAQHFSAAMFQMSGFVSGMNTVTFAVSNAGGGPNGLDVAFSDAGSPPSGPALALNHPAYPDAMIFSPTAVGATSAQTLYVTNNGDATARFGDIVLPAGNFSIDPATQRCGAPLEPGESCSFNVVFAPSSATPATQTGALRISLQGTANPSAYTVNLAGTAAGLPAAGLPSLTYSPSSLVFPATPVNGASAEQLLKITNCAGCAPAIFSDFFLPAHFTVSFSPLTAIPPPNGAPSCSQKTDDPSQFLGAGQSCVVGVTFHPVATAAVTETFGIDLMCDPPCQGVVFSMNLAGSGGSGPVLTFSPNPMVFPDTAAGATSPAVNVTVTNIGDAGKFSNLPTNAIFKVAGFECVGLPSQTIAHNGTCSMPFTFNPPAGTLAGTVLTADPLATPATGLKVGMAAIPSTGEITFSLGASGKVTAAPVNGPAVTFSPTPPLNFRVAVFENSTPQTLTITNSGTKPLIITSYTFGTGNAFGYGSECIGTIQPGEHCSQSVIFHPSTIGTSQDSFVIHDNATPPDQTVSLVGIGLGPAVSLDNTTLKMVAAVGSQSPIASVVLKNTGTADLHISSVGAPGPGGFSKKNDTCFGQTIPPQGTCHVDFAFLPTAAGPQQATIDFNDDAMPNSQTVILLGGISGAAIKVAPDTNLIFTTNVNQQASTNVTLTNVGSVDVTITDITLKTNGTGFSTGDLTSCFGRNLTAAPTGQLGTSCTFSVNFTPASASDAGILNSIAITTSPTIPITIHLTGVSVAQAPPQTLPKTSGVRRYSLDAVADPVDGGTGQFYEDDLDLSLGGPLNLQFVRYYGSGLSTDGYKSSLGVNWMSNFDVGMALNSDTAQVLLFRGKIVTFSKSGASWTLASPTDIGYQFAASGAGYQLMSPLSGLTYIFNSVGKLAGVADQKGNAVTLTQGADGPTSISDGLGRTLTLTYTGGALTSVQDQAGRSVSYSYTGANLTSATDALKKTTQYSYTTAGTFAGLMTKKQLPAGDIPTTQAYDASGKVTRQTDGSGNATQIGYDGNGGTTITGALGGVTKQSNNASGDLGRLTDPLGNSLNATFDSAARRAGVTDKNGNAVQFTYHAPTGNTASRTDELGNTTSYSYSARAQAGFTFYDLTGIAFPDGTSNSMSYDGSGNLIARTAADGATETNTYDANGRIAAASDANKKATSFVYNSDGTLASVKDSLGNVAAYSYTAAGQTSKVADPDGGISALTYDANGRLLSLTDPLGATISYRYDDNGQRVAVTNQDGGTFGFAYSPTGQLASTSDPLGNKTVYAYNAEGQQTSSTNAAGETISQTYDSTGHLMSVSDKGGPRVNYAYDAEGRILSQTDPAGKVTRFGYDPTGQLNSSTKPDGSKYTFAYDKLGRLLSLANPLGEVQSVKRDAMGRVTQVNLPGGLSSTIRFDTLGRTAAITSPNGNTWNLSNDALGRISSITDPLGNATTRSYTGTRLTGMTLPLGTLSLTSDKGGRVTQQKYSDGTTINSAYDSMGLLTSSDGVNIQRDAMGHAVSVNGIAVTYTAAGRLAALTYASGKTVAYAYDNAGRLSTVGDWVGGQTTFTYDAVSRLAGLTYPNGVSTTYTYDANGRLSGIASGGLASIALTRDADGKIVSADRNLPTAPTLRNSSQQFSYNAAAQMNGEQFDAMGRALTESGRTYTWNLASQLTGFRDGANAVALTYDGLGELSTSNISGATETAVFNYATTLPGLSIIRRGGSDIRYFVLTPEGTPLYSIEAADKTRRFYHFDEMGNTTFLTGDNGSVTDTYAITPYGENADHVGPNGNPFTWQGQYGIIEESKGLYFVRQRHYDASAGRFLSPDPLVTPDPRSTEPYTYARGNPLFYADPSGALSWGQISAYQINLNQLDNHIPTAVEATILFSEIWFDPNAIVMYTLMKACPSCTWWQLHYLAEDANVVTAHVPPSNANALSTCLKMNTCDPRLVVGLTGLVAKGLGGFTEASAASIIAQGGGNIIAQGGGNIIAQGGGNLVGRLGQ